MKQLFFLLLFFNITLNCLGQKNTDNILFKGSEKVSSSEVSKGFFLIKETDIKKFCNSHNVKLIKRYENNFFIIYLKEGLSTTPEETTSFYKVNNEWKLSNTARIAYANKKALKKKILVSVNSLNVDLFKNNWILKSPKSKINSTYKNNLIIEIPSKDFDKLLANQFITHISIHNTPKVESDVANNDLSVNKINRVHQNYPELSGEGVIVSIKELLFNINDIDFRDRYLLTGLEAEELDQHASTIGTIISGGGNTSIRGRGVANAATITSSSFLQILPDDDQIFIDNNISIQNHSYGTSIENEYGNEAAAYDINTNANPNLLHVFSSGNSGIITPENGPYAGIPNFSNQTGNFKAAKNIVTVGAINNTGEIDIRSSKGPAFDGRVKPELVAYAPGGTSDAAALVSGVSILLQDVYRNNTNQLPPSSLVKAALIVGSDDIGPKGIDFESGYGNLNAEQSIKLMRNNQLFESSISQDDFESFDIVIPPNVNILKIALTWNDPAANPGDQIALVNDLDLVVTDSDNNSWLPWVLNSTPNLESITQRARRTEDHLNNVEFITIDNPVAGSYTVTIKGTDITTLNQDFSIAYHFIENEIFEWSFPTEINPLINNQSNILRWDSTLSNNIGLLEFNLNEQGWEVINEDVNLNNGFIQFPTDDMITGTAQLRMTVDNVQYLSDIFAVSPEILARVLYNCDEELLLGWNQIPNAIGYNVRFLDERYMEVTQTVTDTTSLLLKNNFDETIFSVEPVFENNIIGVNGRAFDFELQGVQCYFINFLAFLSSDDIANITLNLSTSINVNQVILERSANNTTTIIETFNAPFNNLTLTSEDREIENNTNSYQATIILDDGSRISTEVIDISFPDKNTLILFPNPVNSGDDLNIISNGNNQPYEIIELNGKVITNGIIPFSNSGIEINLPTGLYIFRTLMNNKTFLTKKFIVY